MELVRGAETTLSQWLPRWIVLFAVGLLAALLTLAPSMTAFADTVGD